MVLLIGGASHTGKTRLAQRLLEMYKYPYLSIDHLKMGLIRSGRTDLTPLSDDRALTDCLWPILREMIATAIENGQNLIVEGCYIPFDWYRGFSETYLPHIQYVCLVMSEGYIRSHFADIQRYACIIERRVDDTAYTMEAALADNAQVLDRCKQYGVRYLLIEDAYSVEPERAFPGLPGGTDCLF